MNAAHFSAQALLEDFELLGCHAALGVLRVLRGALGLPSAHCGGVGGVGHTARHRPELLEGLQHRRPTPEP